MIRLGLLALASCGMVGEQPFAERRDSTGIAPWTELGTVEFCLGNLRLIPETELPAGLCVPKTAPTASSCTNDEDCQSREECLCGRCTVVTCQRDSDCATGRLCDLNEAAPRCTTACTTDDSCAASETCTSGACRRACAGDAECQSGEVCSPSQKRCVAPRCESNDDCLASESCVLQQEPRSVAGPTVFGEADQLVMFFSSAEQIYRALATDVTSFRLDPEEPIAEGRAPAMLHTEAGFELYVQQDDQIWKGTSADGTIFSEFSIALDGASPAAAATVEGTELFFVRNSAIHRAHATDGTKFVEDGVALAPSDVENPDLWREIQALDDPALLQDGSVLRLYFSALGIESQASRQLGAKQPPVANFSIGYSASVGGSFSVYPYNPIFDRTQAFLIHLEETAPAIVVHQGQVLLYFEGGEAGSPSGGTIGVATN